MYLFKGTESVISSDPACKRNCRETTKKKRKRQGYLIHTLSDTALRSTVVNWTLYNLFRGPAEIMLTVPLTVFIL